LSTAKASPSIDLSPGQYLAKYKHFLVDLTTWSIDASAQAYGPWPPVAHHRPLKDRPSSPLDGSYRESAQNKKVQNIKQNRKDSSVNNIQKVGRKCI
jgi:hypothetical protein